MNDPLLQISAYFHQELDAAATEELAAWIKSTPENGVVFAREAFIHAYTGYVLRGETAWGHRRHGSVSPNRVIKIWLPVIAAAACLVVVLLVSRFTTSKYPTVFSRVAVLQSEVDAKWSGDAALATGERVAPGTYHLEAGLARLQFMGGADAIVQGPAIFGLSSAKLRVDVGHVVVTCPTKASRELVVEAGGSRVVDLGTEYGVAAMSDGSMEIQVFQGAVELQLSPDAPLETSSLVLPAGDGRHVDRHLQIAEPLQAQRSRFIRAGEFQANVRAAAASDAGRWATYALALKRNPDLKLWADMNPLDANRATADLSGANETLLGPQDPLRQLAFVSGRFDSDQAMEFVNKGAALRVDIPGKFSGLTFAAWVRLYPEAGTPDRHRGLLMSDGWSKPGQVHWQIKGSGLRLSYYKAKDDDDPRFSANVDALWNGQWHLLSSTIDTRFGGTVTHYLDGAVVYQRVIPGPVPPLVLGNCSIGGWLAQPSKEKDDRTLNGRIDDLLVWGRALTATEIQGLYQHSGWSPR